MTKLCGIYAVTHLETGRQYVGQSVDIAKRWKAHAHKSVKSLLSNAIHKHGVQAFCFQVLQLCDHASLDAREVAWIAELDTIKPNGFNLDSGGSLQKVRAPQTKEKIRQRAKAYAAKNGRSLSTRKTDGVEVFHDFEHIDGRKVRCTQWELKQFYVGDYQARGTKFDVSTMISGGNDILRGWMMASRVAELRVTKPSLFPKTYVHSDGRCVTATELEMRQLHGADTNIAYLRRGGQKTCKGWSLVDQPETV